MELPTPQRANFKEARIKNLLICLHYITIRKPVKVRKSTMQFNLAM